MDTEQKMGKEAGTDGSGTHYKNIQEFWDVEIDHKSNKQVVNPIGGIENWYQNADKYWTQTDATVNGVLGGLDFLHVLDIQESDEFLKVYYANSKAIRRRVLDCGAGIGRISKHLLTNWFEEIDLIDQCQNYITKAKDELQGNPKVKEFYVGGLQSFNPTQKYDCIWIQWVASHLTDKDLVLFLQRCIVNLNQGGFIFLKENISSQGFIVDKEDYSVTRSESMYKQIFTKCNLNIKMEKVQPNFPKELFQVKQFALVPKQ